MDFADPQLVARSRTRFERRTFRILRINIPCGDQFSFFSHLIILKFAEDSAINFQVPIDMNTIDNLNDQQKKKKEFPVILMLCAV